MIPYEELAAALEGQQRPAPAAARLPSLGTATLQAPAAHGGYVNEPPPLEDPTLSADGQEAGLEIGDVLSDEEVG